jgi:hypothetical protein
LFFSVLSNGTAEFHSSGSVGVGLGVCNYRLKKGTFSAALSFFYLTFSMEVRLS